MLKKITYLIVLVSAIITVSCRSTKNTVETHTSTVNDSIRLSSLIVTDTVKSIVKTIYVPAIANLNIDSPCDSLGNLKPVNITTSAGNFKATIKSIGNKLKISVQELDSLVSVNTNLKITSTSKDSIIRNLKSKIIDIKKTKKVKYRPTKLTWIFLIWALISTALLFRSKIPFLKFLPF